MASVPLICRGPRCGKAFVAARSDAKYCSKRCQNKASDARRRGETGLRVVGPNEAPPAAAPEVVAPPPPKEDDRGPMEQATRAELDTGDRAGSVEGVAALVLARRIDRSALDSAAGLAGLVKELRATVAEAMKGAPVQDELAAFRASAQAKRGVAG